MALRKINASSARIKPAEVEKTYSEWRLIRFQMNTNGRQGKTVVNAIMQKGTEDVDGNWDMSPFPEDTIRLQIDDLDAAMAEDPALEAVANSLLQAVENIATSEGKI